MGKALHYLLLILAHSACFTEELNVEVYDVLSHRFLLGCEVEIQAGCLFFYKFNELLSRKA